MVAPHLYFPPPFFAALLALLGVLASIVGIVVFIRWQRRHQPQWLGDFLLAEGRQPCGLVLIHFVWTLKYLLLLPLPWAWWSALYTAGAASLASTGALASSLAFAVLTALTATATLGLLGMMGTMLLQASSLSYLTRRYRGAQSDEERACWLHIAEWSQHGLLGAGVEAFSHALIDLWSVGLGWYLLQLGHPLIGLAGILLGGYSLASTLYGLLAATFLWPRQRMPGAAMELLLIAELTWFGLLATALALRMMPGPV